MADLNEVVETVIKKTWDRANKVRITNEYEKYPEVTFEIESATTMNGVFTGSTPKSSILVKFDPTASYPLYSPLDNSILSEDGGNHSMLQIQLYSLFKEVTKGP
jgi:hypothetical protein